MIPFALALTGCGPKGLTVATKPPAELLTCADEPGAPSIPPYGWDWIRAAPNVDEAVERMRGITSQRDDLALDYILAFRAAWGSCKATTNGVMRWAEGSN